jgi:threonylcarbamoyladenosine tRNA methylthiotransferase MtaB
MGQDIAFKTLGCKLNQYETDSLASQFIEGGYSISEFNRKADVYVINTCTVTNQGDQKSRTIINQAKRNNPEGLFVITGCMADHYNEALEDTQTKTLIVKNKQKSSIYNQVDAILKGETLHELSNDVFGFKPIKNGFHTRATIKIQDGCNNFCTFCIIPFVRGKAISRDPGAIIDEIKQVLSYGYKEIVITGVNISRYNYNEVQFDSLIEQILDIEGDFRLRISSLEPDKISDRFIELFQHPKMTPHLHLCLQSGSEKILLQMRRMYTIESYMDIIYKIKSRIPAFNFTTDVIVGFPGENDDDFKQSCKIIEDVGFSHVHTFPFSERTGTRAERMPDKITFAIKKDRAEMIRNLSENNKINYYKSFVGTTQRVLTESQIKRKHLQGYGENYIPVVINNENIIANEFYNVIIKELQLVDKPILIGELL